MFKNFVALIILCISIPTYAQSIQKKDKYGNAIVFVDGLTLKIRQSTLLYRWANNQVKR